MAPKTTAHTTATARTHASQTAGTTKSQPDLLGAFVLAVLIVLAVLGAMRRSRRRAAMTPQERSLDDIAREMRLARIDRRFRRHLSD